MTKRNKDYIYAIFANFFKFLLRIVLFPLTIWWLVSKFRQRRRDKNKIAVFNMSQIDSLSGVDFERFLCEFFAKMGYKVETTKASHDYGADLLIEKNGRRSVVQAKCYGKTVGIKAIQEIVGAKTHYGASGAIVATNNFFSKDAEVLALESDVRLIDRKVIEEMLKKHDFKIEKNASGFIATSQKAKDEFERRFPAAI